MQLEALLEHFHITQYGMGRFQARCPAHDDQRSSLSIGDAEDRVLLYCHAGCTAEAITEALGLSLRDLFYDERETVKQEAEASYIYTDEEGNYLYEVVRFPGKRMAVRTQSGWGVDGVRRVLYQLPQVIWARDSGETLYLVEGEKDVESLHALRKSVLSWYVATCPPFGAGKWKASYVKYFKDADVVVVADRDEAGYKHAEEIRESLEGIARSVKVVQSKVGKDISDHLSAGYTVGELDEVV